MNISLKESQKIEQELNNCQDKITDITKLGFDIEVVVKPVISRKSVSGRQFIENLKFEIPPILIISVITGWNKFYAWLKENYTKGDKIKVRWFQAPKVAFKALQWIIVDVYMNLKK